MTGQNLQNYEKIPSKLSKGTKKLMTANSAEVGNLKINKIIGGYNPNSFTEL